MNKKIVNLKKKFISTKNLYRLIAILIVILFLFSIIPLLDIAKYNYPSADDYNYSVYAHDAWENTHSILNTIKASSKMVINTYNSWQGTFSAIFIMSLTPSLFGEQFYFIGTYILIIALIFATLFICKVIFIDYFKTNKWIYLIVTLVPLAISMQTVPSPIDSFYWYNGSMYYTFFYSLSLILIGLILKFLKTDNKYYLIGMYILDLIIGGGNFVTALVTLIILFSFIIFCIFKKSKQLKFHVITFLFCISAFILSVIAPGNLIRQASCEKINSIYAIFKSFKFGINYLFNWTDLLVILMILFLIPFIFLIIKDIKFNFKFPMLVTIFTFCIFCATFTPPLFATNDIPLRIKNIIYYEFYWLLIVNVFYYVGWIYNKFKNAISENNMIFNKIQKGLIKYSFINAIVIVTIFILYNYSTKIYRNYLTYDAILSLKSGEAEEYHEQMKQRIEIYNDNTNKNPVVTEFKIKPKLLFYADITKDPLNWINISVSDYYNKDTIKLTN